MSGVNKMFSPDLIFTKYEAELLCQNITYITTKGRGVRVSHHVFIRAGTQFEQLRW